MKREIKFNAWDEEGKRMIRWNEIGKPGVILFNDTYHVLQYTGLKDSNGKEIYEGDIVEVTGKNMKKYIQEIKWSKSTGYKVVISEDRTMGYKRYAALGTNNKRCSVVGNIYENPEMI